MGEDTIRTLEADEDFRATAASYLIIRLEANNSSEAARTVIVDAYLNGQNIASASASDQKVPYSTPVNSLTIPVPIGATATFRIRSGEANQVRATVI